MNVYERILALIQGRKSRGLTALELCGMIEASEATVFRNLRQAIKRGEIKKVEYNLNPTRREVVVFYEKCGEK